jgi:hypothetical protein
MNGVVTPIILDARYAIKLGIHLSSLSKKLWKPQNDSEAIMQVLLELRVDPPCGTVLPMLLWGRKTPHREPVASVFALFNITSSSHWLI